MLGAVPLGDGARVGALVVARVGEADRERAHRLGRGLRHRRDDDRRVDPAREQRAERHVGDEPPPHRRAHLVADALEPRLDRPAVRARGRAPATSSARSARAPFSATAYEPGGTFSTARRPERGTYWSARNASSCAQVELARQARAACSSAFVSEANASEPSGKLRVEQRLLAEPVAHEHEPLARAVPQRDREHPLEVLREVEAPLLVGVRDQRRVARAADLVALRLELGPQLAEVVELAVEDRDDVAALALDRLVAGAAGRRSRGAGSRARRGRTRRRQSGRGRDVRSTRSSARPAPGSGASLPRSPQIPHMLGSQGYAVVSCHVERPLDDSGLGPLPRPRDRAARRLPDRVAAAPAGRRRGRGAVRRARPRGDGARAVRAPHALDVADPRAPDRRRPGRAGAARGPLAARARARAALLLRRRLVHGRGA